MSNTPSIAEDATRRAALVLAQHSIPASYHFTGGGCMVTFVPLGHNDMSSDDAIMTNPRLGITADEGEWPTRESPEQGYFIVRYGPAWDDEGTVVAECATTDDAMLAIVQRERDLAENSASA